MTRKTLNEILDSLGVKDDDNIRIIYCGELGDILNISNTVSINGNDIDSVDCTIDVV